MTFVKRQLELHHHNKLLCCHNTDYTYVLHLLTDLGQEVMKAVKQRRLNIKSIRLAAGRGGVGLEVEMATDPIAEGLGHTVETAVGQGRVLEV